MIPAVSRWGEVSGGWARPLSVGHFRKEIRLQAGQRFAAGEKTSVTAKDLRVSVRSVKRWHRAWREGGMEALTAWGAWR